MEEPKIVYPKPDLTADNVIFNGEDVLLIRRKKDPFKGRWALPGGYVNKGEEPIVAAARELQEETGLRAGKLKLVNVYGKEGRDPRGWVVSVAFTAESTTRGIQASDDADEAAWVNVDTACHSELAFDHQQIINDALRVR